jgi:hypothetical protein
MIEQKALETEVARLLDVLYRRRLDILGGIQLDRLLQKNPYLYRAMGISQAEEWVENLLQAFVSSSDETIFGNEFFEPLALWSAKAAEFPNDKRDVTVGGGAGYDVGIETESAYRAIAVKSGTNIFNAQSNSAQTTQFAALQSRLKKTGKQFLPIIGYGYGRRGSSRGATDKIAGQKFWHLLTGEQGFYLRVGSAIDVASAAHRAEYQDALDKKRNQLLREFMINFVDESGTIHWNAILEYNSGEVRPAPLKNAPEPPTSS